MLEKTAASLEPCGLQRVLPGAAKSLRSNRQLHTAFWQHGAADVEPSDAWQALMHGLADSAAADSSSRKPAPDPPNATAIRASTFLLDFLYPAGTVAFLRRFYPTAIDRRETHRAIQSFAKVSPRLYTSSAPSSEAQTTVQEEQRSDLGEQAGYGGGSDLTLAQNFSQLEVPPAPPGDVALHSTALADLLASGNPDDGEPVWHHYVSLDRSARKKYLSPTLLFLSKTNRATDSWRIIELFQQLAPDQWDSNSFLAGLTAEMNLGNEAKALGIFTTGLGLSQVDTNALVEALDLLLASALRAPDLTQVKTVWSSYEAIRERLNLEGITRQLHRVAAVPGLAAKILEGKRYFKHKSKNQYNHEGKIPLLKLLIRRALCSCTDDEVKPLLQLTTNPLAFEDVLRRSNPHWKKLRISIYHMYRKLEGNIEPSHAVLHEVFRAYCSLSSTPDKLAGVEILWGDWHKYHKQPTRRAYQRYMAFYASRGDKARVFSMWEDYIRLYDKSDDVLKADDTFAHLLQVHAVRQELDKVQEVFGSITDKFSLQPSRTCWNILLNAHRRAYDYDGAIRVFEKISSTIGADRWSYATLMAMAASRGDEGFTMDLYRRARRENVIDNDVATLAALIEAYCQNDHFNAAEDVCIRSARRGMKETQLWNRVLHAYAIRANLASINRILNLMTEMGISYDETTYQELLLGLSLCRQSHHALHLLAVAIRDNAFEVQEHHFHTLMGAFIKTAEPHLVLRIHKLMEQCGLRASAASMTHVMTALGQWHKMPMAMRRGQRLVDAVGKVWREFYQLFQRDYRGVANNRPSSSYRSPASMVMQISPVSYQIGRMVYLFTQMKDMGTVEELIELYRYVVQGDKHSNEPLPAALLSSLMLAQASEQRYDTVREIWDVMFAMAKEGGLSAEYTERSPRTSRISPRFKYVLSDALKVMQNLYMAQRDAAGLQKLVEEVYREGFEIDSKNWNLHIQCLVRLKAYRPAFELCEKWLMPNWAGWATVRQRENIKNELPLDLRRKGQMKRVLRPVAHTLYYLARAYMELDKMSPWSPEAAQILGQVEGKTPRCYRAIMTMMRIHTDAEYAILGRQEDDVPQKWLDAAAEDDYVGAVPELEAWEEPTDGLKTQAHSGA